jgi:hypothetical protein
VAGWQVDGQTYALPFSYGVVGFWYNTELFDQAGITTAPATLTDWNDAVDKLKDAGIEPASVGAGDGWPSGADAPVHDAIRAMRLLRARTSGKIGVIGYSAGGHLAARLITEPALDDLSIDDVRSDDSELHVFDRGGHGFGLRSIAGKTVAAWPALVETWALNDE